MNDRYTCEICEDELSQDRIDFEHTICEECEEGHE